jgi:hypothetical protein
MQGRGEEGRRSEASLPYLFACTHLSRQYLPKPTLFVTQVRLVIDHLEHRGELLHRGHAGRLPGSRIWSSRPPTSSPHRAAPPHRLSLAGDCPQVSRRPRLDPARVSPQAIASRGRRRPSAVDVPLIGRPTPPDTVSAGRGP